MTIEYTNACALIRTRRPGALEDFLHAFGVRPCYDKSDVLAWLA